MGGKMCASGFVKSEPMAPAFFSSIALRSQSQQALRPTESIHSPGRIATHLHVGQADCQSESEIP
jgi:hypothetical protein